MVSQQVVVGARMGVARNSTSAGWLYRNDPRVARMAFNHREMK